MYNSAEKFSAAIKEASKANKNFIEDMFKAITIDEFKKVMTDNGINLSLQEAEKAFNDLELIRNSDEGELSEEKLVNVAGGGALLTGAAIVGTGFVIVNGIRAYKQLKNFLQNQ